MIFYCDLQGNLKAFQNETVYQGSNNVTTIYVVAPFNRPVGLNISFTKPNKLVTSPAIMKWVGTLGNVKIPVSFVNIPEQFTDTYNVWAYALPYSITEQNGVVGVSVNAVIADSVDASGQQAYKGNLTTFTGQFTVAYSALPSPPTDIPTEWTQDKVLDLLNNYYNDAIQKIGEMNTLKTDAKDTLVKAINEVFDEIASTNATIGDLSALITDEKTTIVGAINEVDNHADNAQQTADNATELANTGISKAEQAQATANNAVATANEAKATAQTAENNANSAVDKADNAIDRANKAYEKAANNVYAVGFMTLQEAITAVNGYDNTVLKTNDNILVVAQGSPDLYVTSVEATNIPYNFTTVDKFNDDLVKNTVLQIGYYKVAFYETDGQPVTVAYQNVVVKSTDWVASTEFADFPYEAKIPLSNFVDYKTVPQVVFDIADTMSGNYAPICKSGDKCVYIYGKVQNEITLKTVITFAPNVNGASVTGGGYNNRGKWVASTTYAIDDLVYTDNGQFVCIEGITSTTSPEQDTTHWQATFVATGKTKNTLTISGQDNGTEVQKTFDGSTAVEIAFDEQTMTAKEVDGVLKVGAKGTIPEALPQETSVLKSGNLPISGWTGTDRYLYDGDTSIYSSELTYVCDVPDIYLNQETSWKIQAGSSSSQQTYENQTLVHNTDSELYFYFNQVGGGRITVYIRINKVTKKAYADTSAQSIHLYKIWNGNVGMQTYTISDTSITANSDILMELTDDGGVKAHALANGSIQVIRDTVPTQAIPYTYKVKQTNASGQFTLVNHFVPTSLPVTYKKVSGILPTSGWGTNTPIFEGKVEIPYSNNGIYEKIIPYEIGTGTKTYEIKISRTKPEYTEQTLTGSGTVTSGSGVGINTNWGAPLYIQLRKDGVYAYRGYSSAGASFYILSIKIAELAGATVTYTISDTSITANTSVKMYLSDEGGVKAQSKASGSITVIRDSVPTTAIPYEYEVEETSAEGLFEVINAYVPTKTSQLTNDSGFITSADIPSAGEWQNWSDTSVLTEEGLYEIVTTEYPSDGNKTLFVQYEQGKPNNGACWVSVATANSISVVTPICSGDGTLRVERRLANSSDPADLLTFKYRKIN